jgi:YD repeat-containing protein
MKLKRIWIIVAAAGAVAAPGMAQEVRARRSPSEPYWSDYVNAVQGQFSSAQEVCDARAALINWSRRLVYTPVTTYSGTCVDATKGALGAAFFGQHCPDAPYYRMTGHIDGHGWFVENGISYSITYGPNQYCESTVPVVDCWHDKGGGQCQPKGGNPIFPLTGTKQQSENLLPGSATLPPLSLTFDNRRKLPNTDPEGAFVALPAPSFGGLWESTLHKRLVIQQAGGPGYYRNVQASRGAGVWTTFLRTVANPTPTPDSDVSDRLVVLTSGWRYIDATARAQENYDSTGLLQLVAPAQGGRLTYTYSDSSTPSSIAPIAGLLIKVEDQFGRAVRFEYEQPSGVAVPRIARVVDPDDHAIQAGYDASGNLSQLGWPDGYVRKYLYEQSALPWALTGILDENNERHSTYSYDDEGRARSTEYAGGVNRFSIGFSSPPGWVTTETVVAGNGMLLRDHRWQAPQDATMTTPNGTAIDFGTTLINGMPRVTTRSQPAGAGCDASSSSVTYDANGNVASRTDFNGAKSCHAYDLSRNLETARLEGLSGADACPADIAGHTIAAGAAQRKTSTLWHPDWNLPVRKAEPGKLTVNVYNGQPDPSNGNAVASCAPGTALLPDGKPIAVLCKKIEQATSDADGSQGTSVDAMFYDVVLLLHMDGQEGGTSFTDSSPLKRTLVRSGQAAMSAAQAKFGSTSGKFSPASLDTLFLTGTTATQLPGDFTIQAFVFWNAETTANSSIFASGHELFRAGSTGKLSWWYASATRITGTTTIQPGVWYHVALVRKGGTITAYLNGQPEGTYTSTAVMGTVGSNAESVGSWRGSSEFLNGFIDELSITRGVALYDGAFSPPTAPYVVPSPVRQIWTYTYNEHGQMLTARDPRNNLTTYAYYSDTTAEHTRGDLQSVTNPAGHTTQYTRYDKSGRLLESVDANGTKTETTYTPRGWVKTVTTTPPGAAAQATVYDHDGVGQLKKATLSDGTALEYTYDAAHRLRSIKDAAGNAVTYTLDNTGNRTGEELKDASGTLARNITRVYDALNRVQSATGTAP